MEEGYAQVVDGDDDSQVVGQGMQEGPEPESGDGRTVCAHPGPQCARGWDRRPILGILVNTTHVYPRTPPNCQRKILILSWQDYAVNK